MVHLCKDTESLAAFIPVCVCTNTLAQLQTHYPCGPFLMLLWQPIRFDMTALETLTPH